MFVRARVLAFPAKDIPGPWKMPGYEPIANDDPALKKVFAVLKNKIIERFQLHYQRIDILFDDNFGICKVKKPKSAFGPTRYVAQLDVYYWTLDNIACWFGKTAFVLVEQSNQDLLSTKILTIKYLDR